MNIDKDKIEMYFFIIHLRNCLFNINIKFKKSNTKIIFNFIAKTFLVIILTNSFSSTQNS